MSHVLEVDFITEVGLRAVVIGTDLGHRCAYVAIPDSHPLFGKSYDDKVNVDRNTIEVDKQGIMSLVFAAISSDEGGARLDVVFNVHGSLTYSGGGKNYPVETDEKLWWFGFDAGHAGDAPDPELADKLKESFERLGLGSLRSDGVIRTCDYMMNECESLARQLVNFKETGPLAIGHEP